MPGGTVSGDAGGRVFGRWLIKRRFQIEGSSRLQGVISFVRRLRERGSGQAVLQPTVGKLLMLWSIDQDNV